jgi:hypothetical protein
MSSELVVMDALEIMRDLPAELQRDEEIMDCVIASLQEGQTKHSVRLDALEIAQLKTQEAMTQGFKLANQEIQVVKQEVQTVRQEAAIDRIHAGYAKEKAELAQQQAMKAFEAAQDLAGRVIGAEERAQAAKDMVSITAKQNNLHIDPMLWVLAVFGLFGLILMFFMKVEKVEPTRSRQESSTQSSPMPITWDCSNSVSNGSTTDFSKCRRVGGV